ncbi:PH domain-containing protein, partial [Staphylococcus epidermidis]|uniref:PH domain-containing protein n=1 Tax=Staphylococcus epidermidis TaxID=1282 RepID=UPI0011A9FF2F
TILSILFMIILPSFKFKHLTYFLHHKQIHITQPIIFIHLHLIPYFTIQNIHIVHPFIITNFRLPSLSLSTPPPNSQIPLIHIQQPQTFKKQIKQQKS